MPPWSLFTSSHLFVPTGKISAGVIPRLLKPFPHPYAARSLSAIKQYSILHPMGKKNSTPGEQHLLLPTPPTALPVVDTHTHVLSTFEFYRTRYKDGAYTNVFDFVKGMYGGRSVEALLDVWCEAPVQTLWKEYADAAIEENGKKWGGIQYWFALGVHPHDAKKYDDDVEKDILEAMKHPRCVALGEIGLDYHYDNSPRDIQQSVFERQLQLAIRLGKPLTIHTREAEEDTERILKAEVPKLHRIHVHCFTDSPEFAQRLLDHFPNLFIGITGVATFASNLNTAQVIRNMISQQSLSSSSPSESNEPSHESKLRILLETDSPYMVPANIYDDIPALKGKRLPICHSAMIPWTAKFVADVANEAALNGPTVGAATSVWDADKVMAVARENAMTVYGI